MVTILFADFADFTKYVRQHDAEVVHDWLQSIWAEVDGIIRANGGSVGKHMGDAVMALFGDREAREDAPAQAVRAALAIQAKLGSLRHGPGQSQLRMRIGVHCGTVVLESVPGSGEFRATGTAINVASRLQQSAPQDRVLISQEVFRSVYGLFDLQRVRPVVFKGLADPMQAYIVGSPKPRAVARQLRDIEGISTEMVGRSEELQDLQNAFREVLRQGRGRAVTLVGEAGIGKSRLFQEFQRWAELLPDHFWFFYGQATPDQRSMPFALFRDVFASRFEIRDSDSPELARQKVEAGVLGLLSRSQAAAAWAGEELYRTAHLIGHLIGLDFSTSPHIFGLLYDPQQLRQEAFEAVRRFFSALARSAGFGGGQPEVKGLLFVAEDIHWSDQGSLDLLEDLVRGCADLPLMLLCLTRQTLLERRPSWCERIPAHTSLRLETLSAEESRTLVRKILRKAPAVPVSLLKLVLELAEGNPFYIEEFIKMLIDQKIISPGAERWIIQSSRLASVRVPQTLAGVLQARLDGLSPTERSVLQAAAVVGRVFWDRTLGALVSSAADGSSPPPPVADGAGSNELGAVLEALMSKELILRRGASAFAGANEYVFKHELLRSAAYGSLLKKQRRELHARVAAWLLEQSGDRSAEFAAEVASHFEQADRRFEAADWYGRAGHQARAGHESLLAIEYLRKAIVLMPGRRDDLETKRLDWLCCLMDSLCDLARFKDAGRLASSIRVRAEEAGDLVAQARARNGLAFVHERRAANRASVKEAVSAEKLARRAGLAGSRERLRAMHLKGWALYRLGDWTAVLQLSRRTQRLCAVLGDRHGLAATLKLQGVVHLQRGESQRADQCFEEGLQLCNEFGDRRNAAAMLSNLGESARLRGDFATAASYYEKALMMARQIGNRESELVYMSNLSGARVGLGQFREAESVLKQVIPQASNRTASMLSEAFSFLAEASLGLRKTQDALSAARSALNFGRHSGNELDTAIAWRVLGQVYATSLSAARGKPPWPTARAGRCFARSLALFRNIRAEAEQARTLRAWALHDVSRHRPRQAAQRLARARKIFLRLHMRKEVETTSALLQKFQA